LEGDPGGATADGDHRLEKDGMNAWECKRDFDKKLCLRYPHFLSVFAFVWVTSLTMPSVIEQLFSQSECSIAAFISNLMIKSIPGFRNI
jgi:hypothetical protein